MVQLYLNNQLCDLYGSEEIATDYAIAPIANIASRTGAKSVSFKIPLTANNREIIENANVIVNDTTLPYQLIPAQLKANGLDQNLEFAQIKSIKDDINLTLYGSNIDFFSIIKGKKLADLGRVWFDGWTLFNAHASRNNTEGWIYAIIDYHSDSPNTYIDDITQQIDVRGLLPCVFLHSIIDEIISQAGYTANADFLTNTDYRSILIPAFDLKDDFVSKETLLFIPDSTSVVPLYVDSGETGLTLQKGGTVTIEGQGQSIVLRVTEDFNLPATPTVQRFNMLQLVSATGLTYYNGTDNTTDPATVSSLTIGASYRITYDLTFVNNDINDNILFIFGYEDTTQHIVDGSNLGRFSSTLQLTRMLPNMKQSDLLKDTAQKFGLIFQVNNQTQTVYIRRFSEIIANIPNALDWSDKVDYSEKPEIEFDSGYAQINNCTYKEDDSVVKPSGTDSLLRIENDNLEAENDLFESPFAASEQVLRFGGYSIAQIKYFTALGTADETTENVEPRYLIKRMEDFSVFTYTDGTNSFTASSVPVTHFIIPEQSFNAGFENNLLDNSTDLIAMIQQFKSVKMLLRLTPADINQLDFFTPVWIQIKGQAGCYFYISEIKQFKVTSKESTEVSLGKLIT